MVCNVIQGNTPPTISRTSDGTGLSAFDNLIAITLFVSKTDPDAVLLAIIIYIFQVMLREVMMQYQS